MLSRDFLLSFIFPTSWGFLFLPAISPVTSHISLPGPLQSRDRRFGVAQTVLSEESCTCRGSVCCRRVWSLPLQGHTALGWALTPGCSYRETGKEEGLSQHPDTPAILLVLLHSLLSSSPDCLHPLPRIYLSLFCCISPSLNFLSPFPPSPGLT